MMSVHVVDGPFEILRAITEAVWSVFLGLFHSWALKEIGRWLQCSEERRLQQGKSV